MVIRFRWDPDKAAQNLRKHDVSFETAVRAFADPLAIYVQDRFEGGEERWQLIGMIDAIHLLFVAPTTQEQEIDGQRPKPSGSFRPDTQREERDNVMSKKMVTYEVDLANLPPLTAAQRAELEALRTKPDSEIDFSDIPEATEAFWQKAVRKPLYKPTKTSTTLRIDSDVLAWLKAQGKGYQSKINAILRREMLASMK